MHKLKKQHQSEMAKERKKRAKEVQKREKLLSEQKVLESEHQEALKTIEIQREKLKPLNEEVAALRMDKKDLEVRWLELDKLNVDLHNKSMEIVRTVNRGTDNNVRYIKKTQKLE